MNIAVLTMYGKAYLNNKLFDPDSCNIGENLLQPGICLKQYLEGEGHKYNTIDLYKDEKIDKLVLFDIPLDSLLTLNSFKGLAAYIYRRKWRYDYLLRYCRKIPVENRILIVQEPEVVNPASYNLQNHMKFGKILTWKRSLIDDIKYFEFNYPQVIPSHYYRVPYNEKKLLTMICGNKISNIQNELYSKRREVIDFFEKQSGEFDLYGFGWDKVELKNYRGTVDKKLETLSKYKYSICFENMCGVNGYITEKIFDCFFAGVVPVYWGAEDIESYIPTDAFIDMRKFENIEQMQEFIEGICEEDYNNYLKAAAKFLESDAFINKFSVDAYIRSISKALGV